MKQRGPEHEITVFERDPAGLTYGWGVVYWDDLLAQLHDNDPQTARQIGEQSFRWTDQVVHVQDRTAHMSGYGFSTSRQTLLDILAQRAIELGVDVRFEHEVEDLSGLADSDLIVACDGVNSRLRQLHVEQFGTSVDVGRNKYVWLGTSKVFDSFTFPFVQTDAGWIWFHAYGFDSDGSTFIVECSPETWTGLGFDRLDTDQSIAVLERTFERYLDGQPLKIRRRDSDRMQWLNFRTVTNRRWHHDNIVLMGDAAHTTHFTIGSGTRLAIEDAIGLAASLQEHEDVRSAVEAYGRERRAALRLPRRRARYSARWFESIPRYVDLETGQFATLLIRRFSRLLAHVPPGAYYRLYESARSFEVLRRLRRWVSSRPRLSRPRGE
jgi:2-polyprenyl-6-methoxyphenol hydroxylase-like FAD-dependent oxidoreductase